VSVSYLLEMWFVGLGIEIDAPDSAEKGNASSPKHREGISWRLPRPSILGPPDLDCVPHLSASRSGADHWHRDRPKRSCCRRAPAGFAADRAPGRSLAVRAKCELVSDLGGGQSIFPHYEG
jgi:hypothetical protein